MHTEVIVPAKVTSITTNFRKPRFRIGSKKIQDSSREVWLGVSNPRFRFGRYPICAPSNHYGNVEYGIKALKR